MDFTNTMNTTCVIQDTFSRRRLTGINMRDNAYVEFYLAKTDSFVYTIKPLLARSGLI